MSSMAYLIFIILTFYCLGSEAKVIWDGNFGSYASSADLDRWSWNNRVGTYQAYIFGSGRKISDYVTLSSEYCSPMNANCLHGAKISIDGSSTWNGGSMLRTELIPEAKLPDSGRMVVRFSVALDADSPLLINYEHQLVFFENHFIDLKYGHRSNTGLENSLANQWQIWYKGQPKWSIQANLNEWVNFAWDIDFSTGIVSVWFSKNAEPLNIVIREADMNASPSELHFGILRLPSNGIQDPSLSAVLYDKIFVEDSLSLMPNLPSSTISSGPMVVFEESDEVVIIEAESVSQIASGWEFRSSGDGYTGKGYLQYSGGKNPDMPTPATSTLKYDIFIHTSGRWNLQLRSKNEISDGICAVLGNGMNELWVRVDTDNWMKVFSLNPVGQWGWITKFDWLSNQHFGQENAWFDLTSGSHTIEIAGRSNLYILDKIHFILEKNPEDSLGRSSSSI